MPLDKDAIGLRLRKFGLDHFGNLSELAAHLQMKPQSLNSYIQGKSVPGGEILAKLSRLGCNIDWLLLGKNVNGINGFRGNASEIEQHLMLHEPEYLMSREEQEKIDRLVPLEVDRSNRYSRNEFKVLGRIPAGRADFHDQSDWPETSRLEFDPDTHFFLQVDEEFGYSMMPLVNPGDLVLVSLTAQIKDGDLVAARWDSTKGALKLYSESVDAPGMVVLTSYNQAIPPLFLKKKSVEAYKIVLIEKRK